MDPVYRLFAFLLVSVMLLACGEQETISVVNYYDYDREFPLYDSVTVLEKTDSYTMYHVMYNSFHDALVTGLLTIPKTVDKPVPAVIFIHGVKDNKAADYMVYGHQFLVDAGYAVLRIDVANHGERNRHPHKYDFVKGYRFWTRDIIAQTVFDLRRGVDFLEKWEEDIDKSRIGYMGISLGGIIGTVFCGVEPRIKVPVIALAGGGLNLMFKLDALDSETLNYVSIIDPLNFVGMISPRPLLMLNAENDEIILPLTTKLLYEKAGEPKKIIWYPTTHRRVPQDQVFPESVIWFDAHL